MMTTNRGLVAAGHEVTASAAAEALSRGGNACDAALTGMLAACVAEPCLASLGGGGFLLSAPSNEVPRIYDFFCQTPRTKNRSGKGFRPILGNFGTTQQEFHVGPGAVATPGVIPGLFAVQAQECRLSLHDIVCPAIQLAERGVPVNSFQRYIMDVLDPILGATEPSRQMFFHANGDALGVGDLFRPRALAAYLDELSGATANDWWRDPRWSHCCEALHREGGHLSVSDLRSYAVRRREPLVASLDAGTLVTNPPPAMGGALVAAGLIALQSNRASSVDALLRAMEVMNALRDDPTGKTLPQDAALAGWWRPIGNSLIASKGTTHISVVDEQGGLAALTLSNGEGSGHVVADTGIMLNNMLGEEDLQPAGFGAWPPDCRMASMMAPSLLVTPAIGRVALGSGGSNRIRTAMLQVVCELLNGKLSLKEAIEQPRLHYERGVLHYENVDGSATSGRLLSGILKRHAFDDRNLYFGGVHAAGVKPGGNLHAAADPRRGGAVVRAA